MPGYSVANLGRGEIDLGEGANIVFVSDIKSYVDENLRHYGQRMISWHRDAPTSSVYDKIRYGARPCRKFHEKGVIIGFCGIDEICYPKYRIFPKKPGSL